MVNKEFSDDGFVESEAFSLIFTDSGFFLMLPAQTCKNVRSGADQITGRYFFNTFIIASPSTAGSRGGK
jgi:hypothetical protein